MKRITSDRRAAASRANGAKSNGPVTARGKYNSSLNGTRHGILARFLVLPGEMPELFQQQYDDFMEEHLPRTPTERALVEDMVTSWWRKQRIWGMESARITHQVKLSSVMVYHVPVNDPATQTAIAFGDLADSGRVLDLFLRYETRYERQFHRALARLLDLKSRDPEPDTDSDSDSNSNSSLDFEPNSDSEPDSDSNSDLDPDSDFPSRDGNRAVASTSENTQIATPSPESVESNPLLPQDPAARALLAAHRARFGLHSGFPPSPNAKNALLWKAKKVSKMAA